MATKEEKDKIKKETGDAKLQIQAVRVVLDAPDFINPPAYNKPVVRIDETTHRKKMNMVEEHLKKLEEHLAEIEKIAQD